METTTSLKRKALSNVENITTDENQGPGQEPSTKQVITNPNDEPKE